MRTLTILAFTAALALGLFGMGQNVSASDDSCEQLLQASPPVVEYFDALLNDREVSQAFGKNSEIEGLTSSDFAVLLPVIRPVFQVRYATNYVEQKFLILREFLRLSQGRDEAFVLIARRDVVRALIRDGAYSVREGNLDRDLAMEIISEIRPDDSLILAYLMMALESADYEYSSLAARALRVLASQNQIVVQTLCTYFASALLHDPSEENRRTALVFLSAHESTDHRTVAALLHAFDSKNSLDLGTEIFSALHRARDQMPVESHDRQMMEGFLDDLASEQKFKAARAYFGRVK